MCIVVNANEIENMLPSFGLIKHIFITDVNLPFAICKLFQTNYFDEHYQAFNVTPKSKYICIYLDFNNLCYGNKASQVLLLLKEIISIKRSLFIIHFYLFYYSFLKS